MTTSNNRNVLLGAAVFVIAILFVLAVAAIGIRIFDLNTLPPIESSAPNGISTTPGIQLEVYPKRGRLQLEKEARQTLTTYAWTDASKQSARVPIERAMKLKLEKGYAVRTEPKQ
ncbi:MAG: hypothetical protein AUJ72_04375 [Candidatus Omnitrophica bacterium CG1_02_46_14]|nr:MAG: hypothetical protein AUJ72_04375 [Candidatus Omnitrophica bacterium CG1_02_46_14]